MKPTSSRPSARRRVEQVARVDAGHDQGAELAVAGAGSISSVSRPPPAAWRDAPGHAVSTRAAASSTGRPPGSRLGRQPASTAPRSPARRGTQASWRRSRRPARRRRECPGKVGHRSPTRMTAPGPAAAPRGPRQPTPAHSPRPRAGGDQGGVDLGSRAEVGSEGRPGGRFLRTALRSRRKTIADSSSGSKATSRTRSACSRSA